jgi:hypothetical protein
LWRKSSNCYDTRIVCFSGFYGQSVTSHLIENTYTLHIFVYSSNLTLLCASREAGLQVKKCLSSEAEKSLPDFLDAGGF